MYTRITPTNNGREAIMYARGGENERAHNDNETRNLLIGNVNMLPDEVMSYEDQMEKFWNRAGAQHKVQIRRIIGSFSKKELDPEDENSKYKALQMAQLFAEKYYPNRQAAIFIQADGAGGCLHFHLLVNDCDMISAKGCNRDQQKYWYVEKYFDEVAKDFIQLYEGQKETENKKSQYEREKAQEKESGKEVGYIWKDDLKDRIRISMTEASDRDDFLKKLSSHGVEGKYKTTKGNGDFILYELTDLSGFEGDLPKKREYFRVKSYKMGSDYGLEELDRQIAGHQKKMPDAKIDVKLQKIEKTEEQRRLEYDKSLQAKFNILAGIDYFKNHKTWEMKDNFNELMAESEHRWKEFKSWYPNDYEERLKNKDISAPKKPVNENSESVNNEIFISTSLKPHTKSVLRTKSKQKGKIQKEDQSVQVKKPVQIPRRETEEERQRRLLIEKIKCDSEEIDQRMRIQASNKDEWTFK